MVGGGRFSAVDPVAAAPCGGWGQVLSRRPSGGSPMWWVGAGSQPSTQWRQPHVVGGGRFSAIDPVAAAPCGGWGQVLSRRPTGGSPMWWVGAGSQPSTQWRQPHVVGGGRFSAVDPVAAAPCGGWGQVLSRRPSGGSPMWWVGAGSQPSTQWRQPHVVGGSRFSAVDPVAAAPCGGWEQVLSRRPSGGSPMWWVGAGSQPSTQWRQPHVVGGSRFSAVDPVAAAPCGGWEQVLSRRPSGGSPSQSSMYIKVVWLL